MTTSAARRGGRLGGRVRAARAVVCPGAYVATRVRAGVAAMVAVAVIAVAALAGCAKDSRTVVTVYTPHGVELMGDLQARFERDNPNIDIEWVDLGSQVVLDRLRAEKDAPKADLWFGAPGVLFEIAAREGLLDVFVPSWAASVPAEARDSAGYWIGTYLTPEVIGYNSAAVRPADVPRDWDDLIDRKWRGKLVMRDPMGSGTMRVIFGALLQRSLEETGSTERGFDYLRKLDANTREYTSSPALLYQKLGRKQGVVTLYNMSDMATLEARTRIPVKAVIPRSGTPLLVDGIAIVRGARHAEQAKLFFNFVASREMMLVAARDHERIPARTDLVADSLPQWIREATREIKPMALDRRLMGDSLDRWMRFWAGKIKGKYRAR